MEQRPLEGQMINQATIGAWTGRLNDNQNKIYSVTCSCGNSFERDGNGLRSNERKGVGPMCRLCNNKTKIRPPPTDVVPGMRNGMIVVLSYDIQRRRAVCKCDCGKTTEINRHAFKQGQKSCGCRAGRTKAEEGVTSMMHIIYSYKSAAKIRGLIWALSNEAAIELFQRNCFYCGGSPSNVCSRGVNGGFTYNGIDRVDNTLGYLSTNVVSCCGTCNTMKMKKSKDGFIEHCRRVAAFWSDNHR